MFRKAAVIAAVVVVASLAVGGPNTITYQGCVVGSGGAPVADGSYPMRFSIWSSVSGGTTPLWQEVEGSVAVANGLFSATLGDGTTFGSLFANNNGLWMEVAIDLNKSGSFETNEIYAPRQKMAGAAWAMDANSADLLDGYHANAFVRSITAGAGLLRSGTSQTATLSANSNYLQRRVTGSAPVGQFIRAINSDGTVVSAVDQVGIGDITGVAAGTGLSGGGATGNVTLSANTGYLQRRVTGSAAAGQFIRAINADGTVVAAADQVGTGDITAVNAGTGLTGGGTSGSVSLAVLFGGAGVSTSVAHSDHAHASGIDWSLWGNATTSGTHFLGTTNFAPFDVRVDGRRALRIEPTLDSWNTPPNIIFGHSDNSITSGLMGATISGGGDTPNQANSISGGGYYGAIGGGIQNTVVGYAATIAGGRSNAARDESASIGGGRSNQANGIRSTVGGGQSNNASGVAATIGGGNWSVASGDGSFVGGGNTNTASGLYATVSGGAANDATSNSATVGGGFDNTASGEYVTVAGGYRNDAGGAYATIGGGRTHYAPAQYATISGGYDNGATGEYATVAGGFDNSAWNQYATVSGGRTNIASGSYSTVGGGASNAASQQFATVGGGSGNTASGLFATVGGGSGNTASGALATVGGGGYSSATADYAFVGSGYRNTASFRNAVVGGGEMNAAAAQNATVGGGFFNRAAAIYATVGGGYQNWSRAEYATVGGGQSNNALGEWATIAGGENNNVSGAHATVGGGNGNTAADSGATIAGGEGNQANGDHAFIGGGYNHSANGLKATIGGGHNNASNGAYATVGGGYASAATGDWATIAGGWVNAASANFASVGGGGGNRASGFGATVSGGVSNQASGMEATIPGGYSNEATANYAFAAGQQAKALHAGVFVWNDSSPTGFPSTGNNQFLVRATGGVGINTNVPGGFGLRVAGTVGFDGQLDMAADGSPARIVGLANPVNPQDAATKLYVDNAVLGSVGNADTLDGQHGSFYQNASNISSGTLGNSFFSAYSNLTADGRLDNNDGTDLLTRTQSDGRYSSFRWEEVTGTTKQAESNRGYVPTNAAEVTITLPPTPAIGDIVCVNGGGGGGAGGYRIAQNGAQKINIRNLGLPNYSATWAARETARYWTWIASSADGIKLVACVNNGQIYTSTDCGVTWTARDSNRQWRSVASSADGVNLVACANGGQIYTSTDSGVTWTARESNRNWRSVASSADGSKLVACCANPAGQIYTSGDYGANWFARAFGASWDTVASSADGTKLIACISGSLLQVSVDSGLTWNGYGAALGWECVATSGDGTKMVACVSGGQIYTSTDTGQTWTARETNRSWIAVASSGDGTRLVAAEKNGKIYTSSDSGLTWTPRESNRLWAAVCTSEDGTRLGACISDIIGFTTGQIYTCDFLVAETTAGTGGYLRAYPKAAVELQYVGSDTFAPLSFVGRFSAK